ncbi:MAG: RNase H family protein [Succinivibrionaceae bacterium]
MNIVFTDGAVTAGSSCGAAVLLKTNKEFKNAEIVEQAVKINEESTNNEAELFGILKAIELINFHNYGDDDTNIIFSDSEYAIFSLTKWIKDWIKTYTATRNNSLITPKMMTKGGKEVKNCKLICTIINLIAKNNIKVKFMHIRGHMNKNNADDIKTQAAYYAKRNNIDYKLALSQSEFICKYNDYIDNLAKTYLEKYIYGELSYQTMYAFEAGETQVEWAEIDETKKFYTQIDIETSGEFNDEIYGDQYILNKKTMEKYFSLVE